MNRLAAAVAAVVIVTAVHAQDKKPTQQTRKEERNGVCTAQADDRNLRGATRRAYMRECLKGGSGKQIAAQQQKILECTEEAEDQSLEARERRQFMTECLRG
jgi:psiF repeat-containing protein